VSHAATGFPVLRISEPTEAREQAVVAAEVQTAAPTDLCHPQDLNRHPAI